MHDCLPTPKSSETPTVPPLPIENVLISELIVEYLSFNGYDQTLSMFAAESQTDQGGFVLGESFIRTELEFEHPNERNVRRRGGRVSSAKGVHHAVILHPVAKTEKYTRCV